MKLRKKAIGDMYLAASIIFIFLTFVAVGSGKNNMAIAFLSIGMAIALFGIRTKKVMADKEKIEPKKAKSRKKK